MLSWTCKNHTDLTLAELYGLLQLRAAVFVIEQHCLFHDLDSQDLRGQTAHLMAWEDDRLAAYCRLLDPAYDENGEAVIGRVVVAPAWRGSALGHELMRRAVAQVQSRWPGVGMYLGAQAHLREFYGAHGFAVATDEYMEDGIPHVGMRYAPIAC
ncbi:GNAT family N-acetyltransferase [Bordetella sp. FB-8]|uniref:GNAT family N-acetyltransferase n=1 Tax=Bordetella sp. FB-8 TaxID=1159870 RepID=UPI00036C73B9|nr:GNAT family N-acetyltransferase [Bordetella sp. FB-8]